MKILLPASAQNEADHKKAIAAQKAKEANQKERRRSLIVFLVLTGLTTISAFLNFDLWISIALGFLTLGSGIVLMFYGADDHIDMIIETSELAAKAKANLNRKK